MKQETPYSYSATEKHEHSHKDWPRDFDFRVQVAEQKEVIKPSASKPLDCSEYDF